jgi:hypothetical protein
MARPSGKAKRKPARKLSAVDKMAGPSGKAKRKPARKLSAVDKNKTKKDAKEIRSGGYTCGRCLKLTKGHTCPFVGGRFLKQKPLKTKVQKKPRDGTEGIYHCKWCGQLTKGHICTYNREFRYAYHARVDSEDLMNAPLPEVSFTGGHPYAVCYLAMLLFFVRF